MRELGDAMDNELNAVKPVVEEGGMDGARKFIKGKSFQKSSTEHMLISPGRWFSAIEWVEIVAGRPALV